MTRISPSSIKEGATFEGVIVYQPTLVKMTYSFMTRVDKDGNVTGTAAEKTCLQSTQKEELSVIADFSKPFVIRNASGWLSAAKFSVTLANGLLVSVNAEPTQKASDLLTAASTLVKEFGALDKGLGTPACNAGPILSAVVPFSLSQP